MVEYLDEQNVTVALSHKVIIILYRFRPLLHFVYLGFLNIKQLMLKSCFDS